MFPYKSISIPKVFWIKKMLNFEKCSRVFISHTISSCPIGEYHMVWYTRPSIIYLIVNHPSFFNIFLRPYLYAHYLMPVILKCTSYFILCNTTYSPNISLKSWWIWGRASIANYYSVFIQFALFWYHVT